jgi:hypothetical protein
LAPTGYADTLYQAQTGPGSKFDAFDFSTTIDYMPSQNLTLKLEFVHRYVEDIDAAPGTPQLKGYFAGPGGVTSPSGFEYGPGWSYSSSGAANPPPLSTQLTASGQQWLPDLVKAESRLIMAFLVRF